MMLISDNPNKMQEFRGLVYEGKEILATIGCVIEGQKITGWNCIMEDGEKQLVPKAFFEKEMGEKIIVGVE